MMCPICGIEMRIGSSRTKEDEDTHKKVIEQDLVCRNSKCPNFKTVVETVEITVD